MALLLYTINHSKSFYGYSLLKCVGLYFLFQICFTNNAAAQPEYVKDSALLIPPHNNAYQNYISAFGKTALFYNGSEYIRPAIGSKGHPFFENSEPQKGNVLFDGVLYRDVLILFDIVSGVLTTVGYHNIQLQLPTEKIDYFTINNRMFIPFWEAFATKGKQSFFEVLYQNDLNVLAQNRKSLERSFRAEDPYVFKSTVTYFIQKDGKLIKVNNEKTLLEALADQKETVKKFIKTNRLNFNTMPVETLVKVAGYYQQIKK